MSFTCYFCNKLIKDNTEVGHATVCSRVLEACPYKCGSYVARAEMTKHKRECTNASQSQMSKAKSMASLAQVDNISLSNRSIGNGSIGSDSGHHSMTNGVSQEKMIKNLQSLNAFCAQFKQNIDRINYQNNAFNQWKSIIDTQINDIKKSLEFHQTSKENTDGILYRMQELLFNLDQLPLSFKSLKDAFKNEQLLNRKINSDVTQNLEQFRLKFQEDVANLMTTISIQNEENKELKSNLEKTKAALEEQQLKLTNVVFDLRSTTQTASETEEKVEILERENNNLKRTIEELTMDIENFQLNNDKSSMTGKLMWKIHRVQGKLQTAKETQCCYHSSALYTHEYGYKINLSLYLNGRGKWKDRYALLCMNVLKGDYDLMLKWPCCIEGSLTLRDLENFDDPRHFSKSIVAKRQSAEDDPDEPKESDPTFMFIPHNVLFKEKHVKGDTIFLELTILRTR
ncbi:TNF receptor-associated factor 3 [Aethina tumida]|uniref:TNF receptor-associated factor 3 n=1 Tax=Aethina tumida TaxID=116153 RepID=UPI00214942C7|nr:TNF receptor-associated factor 3 [Aethina tumida]